ncbi:hypothetical protein [Streptomyces sp. NBC_01006]|uniref:hypothetical protein n=1 Tax=Streptomyces sp. NBC_01006 TaxID=2903716 RepID=UPI003867D523|nr:hypothetical protein OG509_20430 [Streptomyces sp. NBC_01006]
MADPAADMRLPVLARRLPGRAKRRTDVLREYEKFNADRRRTIPPVLWPFFAPDPDRYYRWRVQLDCACIKELMTPGDDTPPSERQWRAPRDDETLPPGQLYCWHDESGHAPYRDIVEWGDRREVSFPADPAEPPEWADAEVWAVLRHDKPHTSAFWKVTLDCGHLEEVVAPTLDWKPADGPRLADASRVKQMTEEFEQLLISNPTLEPEHQREHTRRMLASGWPIPSPERQCYTCPHARVIVAYQRVGWLTPRNEAPKPENPAPPARDVLERRLRRAEAEAEKLRTQLNGYDEGADACRVPAQRWLP